MTPACRFLKQQNAQFRVHTYDVAFGDSANGSHQNYGQAVADSVGISHDQLFKTLVISLNGDAKKPAVCIVPTARTLNLKLAAKAFGVKSAAMAETALAEKATGYVVGGISPFVSASACRLHSTAVRLISQPSIPVAASAAYRSSFHHNY